MLKSISTALYYPNSLSYQTSVTFLTISLLPFGLVASYEIQKSVREETAKRIFKVLHQKTDFKSQ